MSSKVAPIPSDLAALPKAELHVHLEGAMRPAMLEELAARAGISVPAKFDNLNHFIDHFSPIWNAMTMPGDYARIVREYCEDAVRHNIRYVELELATIGRTHDHLGEAIEEARRQRDVTVRFIVGNARNLPVEVAWAMLKAVNDAPEIVAFGLAGREDAYPPEPFSEVFAEARRRGLRAAPHAGEDAGPASVRGALDALGAERIQHGVRVVEDPALLAEVVERRVPLAVCPTSNVLLGVARTIEEHPLRGLWEAGVVVSVNTDDPGYFRNELTGEYAIAGRLLGLDREGYGRLANNAIEGSFAPDETKAELRSAVQDWVAKA